MKLCKISLFFLILFCQEISAQTDPDLATNPIYEKLTSVKGKGILFGHQDDLAYGVGWEYIRGESDVKRIAGDYPAVFGWELGGLELNHKKNLDKVPFEQMKSLAIMGDAMGGINTFSWHPYAPVTHESSWNKNVIVVKHIIPGGKYHEAFKEQLDKIAAFFHELKTEDGQNIPFIFRPWHEMDGNWFWWGSKQCTPEEFQQLFTFTVKYLRVEKGLKHMLIAYSPDRNFKSETAYLTWYPGDAYVDILGVDNYSDLKKGGSVKAAIDKLHIVIKTAEKKEKIAAFTETGLENVSEANWYTDKLGQVLADPFVSKSISYVMVWRNDGNVHYFFPYLEQKGAAAAKELLDRKNILLLEDFKSLLARTK
ncbi:glycoside hydrolase family 26 protein [Lutimonas sp.]|uniref:glycoside hydrolase family 26 protein n=1 Tax=Lutimonas sp. TaxID=1872403 RepID=UPI003D9B648F